MDARARLGPGDGETERTRHDGIPPHPVPARPCAVVGCNDSQKAAQADLLQQNEDLAKQLEAKNDSLNSMGEQLSRLEQTNASLEEQLAECTRRAAAPAPAGERAEVVQVAAHAAVPAECELYVLGGGEDGPEVEATRELSSQGVLHRNVDRGAVVFALCAGLQLVGTRFPAPDGQPVEGLGLLDCATERTGEPRAVGELLVTGDLNDVAWSRTTRQFRRLSRLLDPRVGRGMFNTFHAGHWFLRWPLDHIFHSDHFTLRSIRRLPSIGSDHFPLLSELVLTPHLKDEQQALGEEP